MGPPKKEVEINLFDSIKNVSEEQWHTKFKILKDDPFGEGERNIL